MAVSSAKPIDTSPLANISVDCSNFIAGCKYSGANFKENSTKPYSTLVFASRVF